MYNHEPADYRCTFCVLVAGDGRPGDGAKQQDLIPNGDVTALLSTHWWSRNEGHVLVVPNRHVENI